MIHAEYSSILPITVVLTLYLLLLTHRVVWVLNHQGGFMVHCHHIVIETHKLPTVFLNKMTCTNYLWG